MAIKSGVAHFWTHTYVLLYIIYYILYIIYYIYYMLYIIYYILYIIYYILYIVYYILYIIYYTLYIIYYILYIIYYILYIIYYILYIIYYTLYIIYIPQHSVVATGNGRRVFKLRIIPFSKWLPSGKHTKNYGTSSFSMGKSTISMAIFNSFLYVYQKYPINVPLKSH